MLFRSEVLVQSTTRSPVVAADVDGYALRRTLRFPAPDEPGRRSLLHNVVPPGEQVGDEPPYDDVVVVVDTPAAGAAGLVEALRLWAGHRVALVVL